MAGRSWLTLPGFSEGLAKLPQFFARICRSTSAAWTMSRPMRHSQILSALPRRLEEHTQPSLQGLWFPIKTQPPGRIGMFQDTMLARAPWRP